MEIYSVAINFDSAKNAQNYISKGLKIAEEFKKLFPQTPEVAKPIDEATLDALRKALEL